MSLESVGRAAPGVEDLLAEARALCRRVSPEEAVMEVERGAALIDIRIDEQVNRDGEIPLAERISRNVLEWRLEPGGEHSVPELARPGRVVLVICDEGYQSSLAAANLARMGVDAGDVIGGFQSWRQAGLPVVASQRETTR
jgi:rhodanese-related sulfurtransferase